MLRGYITVIYVNWNSTQAQNSIPTLKFTETKLMNAKNVWEFSDMQTVSGYTYLSIMVQNPSNVHQCDFKFTQSSTLKAHIKTHTMEKSHQCPNCNKSFGTKLNMENHSRRHSGIKPFSCNFWKIIWTFTTESEKRFADSVENLSKINLCWRFTFVAIPEKNHILAIIVAEDFLKIIHWKTILIYTAEIRR